MRVIFRLLALFFLTVGSLPAAGLAPQITFSPEEISTLQTSLDQRWKEMIDVPAPKAADREVFEMLLDAIGTNWHPERWDHILDVADAMQARDIAADRYHDIFGVQRMTVLALFYADKLSPGAKSKLVDLCRKAVEPSRTAVAELAHTNMAEGKAWNLITLGEFLGDSKLADEGYDFLRQWIVFSRDNGLSEFNSPTYSLADIGSMSLLSQYVQRPEGRANARAGLAFVWYEVVANWFPPGERLSGAHSRNYHALLSEGVVSMAMGKSDDTEIRGVYWKALNLPPAGINASACQVVPRFVAQKWGTDPGQYAVNYVGRDFSIASAGAAYSYQDTPLSLNWGGGAKVPNGFFITDGRGDPYGGQRVATRKDGSHPKAVHLIPNLMSAQHGTEVLFLSWINLEDTRIVYQQIEQLTSNLVLPTMDSVWVGDKKLSLKTDDHVDLPDGAAFVGQRGKVLLGVRILTAADLNGQPVKAAIFNDGPKDSAFRIACVQSGDKPTKGRAHIALLVRMAEDVDATTFRKSFAAEAATAEKKEDILTVAAPAKNLKLSVNLKTNERLTCEGGDAAALRSVLWVNGKDLGSQALQTAPALRSTP